RFVYIVHAGDAAKTKAVELARRFRAEGVETLLEFAGRGFKSQFGRANKLGASWVLIIGEDELARGEFLLKDMATGSQTSGTPDVLIQTLL
ncbi:MAG: histidine--tRNA ligase, partial [Acidobacteria bacterium]|nr:histidine--tRNA ligase [Acidobacteriota bacterium]